MVSSKDKIKLGIFLLASGFLILAATYFSKPLFDFLFVPKLFFKNKKTLTLIETKPQDEYTVRIIIPDLDLDLSVLPARIKDKDWPVATNSANYLVGSGVPGEKGNVVIYGHALWEIFGPILNLKKDTEIILETKNKKIFRYQVEETKAVWPNETKVIETTSEETLTIYTCYGLFDSQRFVAVAKPIKSNRPPFAEATAGKEVVEVKRVIDGDTIELTDGRRVRYIGVNTPETVDPRKPVECPARNASQSDAGGFGKEAKEKNQELVEGKIIEMEKDVSEVDVYGRYLRYVYVDDIFVNSWLVENGYANTMTVPPDVKYQKLFLEKEKIAREEKRGLWRECY